MNVVFRSLLVGAGTLLGSYAGASSDDMTSDCRVGIYRLNDHTDVDIAPSDEGRLRWRRPDGTSGALTRKDDGSWSSTFGWTVRSDGKQVTFSKCAAGEILFDGVKGKRLALDVTETRFRSGDAELAGRLLMPKGSAPVPIVVLVHGSEDSSARDFYYQQRMFPSAGVGAFVYDKRGTGASSGGFSHDYGLLAKDAVAAMTEAKRLAGARAVRVGYQGTSQGGWVAPLAATMAPVDFVVVGYGLAVSPIEEDRSVLELDMTRHGYGAEVVAKALEVGGAAEVILASNFKSGFDRLDAVRARYSNEPWFKFVHGNITFFMLALPEAEVRERGPKMLPGLQLYYDPMPVLRSLNTPQLWILGEDDLDAPSMETMRRLRALAAGGKPIDVAVFPHAEHGMYEFETAPDGTRTSTRNSDGYFAMMRDYIVDGRLKDKYGISVLHVTKR